MPLITLPKQCNRSATDMLLPSFLDAVGNDPIDIDASEVSEAGQAILQLLVSAKCSSGGANIKASKALIDAATIAGLHEVLFDTPAEN